jgi:hypothetical protein
LKIEFVVILMPKILNSLLDQMIWRVFLIGSMQKITYLVQFRTSFLVNFMTRWFEEFFESLCCYCLRTWRVEFNGDLTWICLQLSFLIKCY